MSYLFANLFEMLPEAEDLLNLEPEELAGRLLLSFGDNKDNINLRSIIACKPMSEQLKRTMPKDHHLKYPRECYEDVLYALMEAWQWLESKVLVAQKPADLDGYGDSGGRIHYFVTRRGRSIKTLEDFENYRKNNSTM